MLRRGVALLGVAFLSTPSAGRATGRATAGVQRFSKFLSTPSAGRATLQVQTLQAAFYISIHALRGEGDSGARVPSDEVKIFLSTPSAGRATRRAR